METSVAKAVHTTKDFGSWYSLNGRICRVSSAKEVVINLLNELYEFDNALFEKCLENENNYGRNRQYIALRKVDLYPERPDLTELSVTLKGGYFLLTNFSNQIKDKILKMALDIIGMKKGIDVDYNL